MRPIPDDERGSILPLTIGYAVLALAIVLVSVNAISLFVAQKRVDALADASALAASDGFEIIAEESGAAIVLDHGKAAALAEDIVAVSPVDAHLVELTTTDGSTARAIVSIVWHPFLVSAFLPGEVMLTGTATSRASLAG
ncbi:hypothetical protein GCM10010915_16920 [Microbacterium faecale]|uniref:Putative Flp pilus-assembly TadG-like N-terminal domain-containing protein n=1 Tax=Microbacterium faecale TaxID=1804630 RepID=A0A916YAK7_9MICO|nr:pilus assembly protein TadG-related protein [Microbacterium faecale]GGD36842.1 hypothetical protein GCM10010915_16920 [Microbacterium faecale]